MAKNPLSRLTQEYQRVHAANDRAFQDEQIDVPTYLDNQDAIDAATGGPRDYPTVPDAAYPFPHTYLVDTRTGRAIVKGEI